MSASEATSSEKARPEPPKSEWAPEVREGKFQNLRMDFDIGGGCDHHGHDMNCSDVRKAIFKKQKNASGSFEHIDVF